MELQIQVPSDRAHEAFDWLEERGYYKDADPWMIVESRMFLDEMLYFKPRLIPSG